MLSQWFNLTFVRWLTGLRLFCGCWQLRQIVDPGSADRIQRCVRSELSKIDTSIEQLHDVRV